MVAAHAIHLTDAEIALVARQGVKVVHCPVSNMKLASGGFPFGRMQAAGVRVSLGTDGCSSNNNLSMLEEMKVAALQAKLLHGDPKLLPARTAFEMATLNGAAALGLDCGKIAVGRLADCMLVDLANHRLAPGYNLEDDMVYSADSSCIDTVVCDGKILMRGGGVEGEEEIVAEARRYKKKVPMIGKRGWGGCFFRGVFHFGQCMSTARIQIRPPSSEGTLRPAGFFIEGPSIRAANPHQPARGIA